MKAQDQKLAAIRSEMASNGQIAPHYAGARIGYRSKKGFRWYCSTGKHCVYNGAQYIELQRNTDPSQVFPKRFSGFFGGVMLSGSNMIQWYTNGEKSGDPVPAKPAQEKPAQEKPAKAKTVKPSPLDGAPKKPAKPKAVKPAPALVGEPAQEKPAKPAPKTAAYKRSGTRPLPKSVQNELAPVREFLRRFCSDSEGNYSQNNSFVQAVMAMTAELPRYNAMHGVKTVRAFKQEHGIAG